MSLLKVFSSLYSARYNYVATMEGAAAAAMVDTSLTVMVLFNSYLLRAKRTLMNVHLNFVLVNIHQCSLCLFANNFALH